jgi:hypothetical protein
MGVLLMLYIIGLKSDPVQQVNLKSGQHEVGNKLSLRENKKR